MHDYESTDLEGAAYLESMREIGWSDDGDDPREWDDIDLDRAMDSETDPTEGFYSLWDGSNDPAAGEVLPNDPYAPCGYCRRCAIHDDPGGCLTVEAFERQQQAANGLLNAVYVPTDFHPDYTDDDLPF